MEPEGSHFLKEDDCMKIIDYVKENKEGLLVGAGLITIGIIMGKSMGKIELLKDLTKKPFLIIHKETNEL